MTPSPSLVVFDMFGTLVCGHREHTNPYRQLLTEFSLNRDAFRAATMAEDLSFRESVLKVRGGVLSAAEECRLQRAEADLEEELGRIRLFEDTIPTLECLRDGGVTFGIISNLAKAYHEPVHRLLSEANLLPPEHLCLWSFREGLVKPQSEIYRRFCERAGCAPGQVLMIGDSERNDLRAPREAGMQARLLLRGDRGLPPEVSAGDTVRSLIEVPALVGLGVSVPRLSGLDRGGRDRQLAP